MSAVVQNLKVRVPTLRLHVASSQWIADLGGKTHYFGRDEQNAWTAFLPKLKEWREANNRHDCVTVAEAVESLVARVAADCGHNNLRLSRAPLKPFVDKYRTRDISTLTVHDIEQFKTDSQAIASPKTVNHRVGAVKRLIRYAAFKGWRPAMEMSFISMVALPAPMPKHLTINEVSDMLDKADASDTNLGVWLRLSILTGARPSETLRLIDGQGKPLEDGVLAFPEAKTNKSVSHPRCLVLSAAAQRLLPLAVKQWKWQCTYSDACSKITGRGPHRLRHTSAYLIHRLPGEAVSRDDTDIFLGHYPGWVSITYNVIRWETTKALAERYSQYLQTVLPRHFPV